MMIIIFLTKKRKNCEIKKKTMRKGILHHATNLGKHIFPAIIAEITDNQVAPTNAI